MFVVLKNLQSAIRNGLKESKVQKFKKTKKSLLSKTDKSKSAMTVTSQEKPMNMQQDNS